MPKLIGLKSTLCGERTATPFYRHLSRNLDTTLSHTFVLHVKKLKGGPVDEAELHNNIILFHHCPTA